MAVIETWFEQDLQKAVQVQHLDGSLFSNNANGNRIGVVVYNNGVAASLSGTVSGYAVLPDGTTVPCTGSLSGNRASVLIPAAAYQPGIIFVSVFLTSGSTVTTLAAVAANVQQARTDSQVSPGSAVTDWTQTINAAMQSVVTANAENMAVEYGSLTYPVPVGKYTIYNDLLYRCTTPIATAESWTASHWTRVKIADEVSDLKSAITKYNSYNFLVPYPTEQSIYNGITWSWDGETCYYSGTSTGVSFYRLYWIDRTHMPEWMKPGETYWVEYKSTDKKVSFNCYFYKNGEVLSISDYYLQSGFLTIPSDAEGAQIRLIMDRNLTVNGSVSVALLNNPSNADLAEQIKNVFPLYVPSGSTFSLWDDMPSPSYFNGNPTFFKDSIDAELNFNDNFTYQVIKLVNRAYITNPSTNQLFLGQRSNSGVQYWVKSAIEGAVTKMGAVPVGSDINNLIKPGYYTLTSSGEYIHSPFNGHGGVIVVFPASDSQILQIAIQNTTPPIEYFRISLLGTFPSIWTHSEGNVITNNYTNEHYNNTYNITCNPQITTDTNNFLAAPGDTRDMTGAIQTMLNNTKVCRLGPGDFYVTGIEVPTNGALIGSGWGTRIILAESVTNGYAVKLTTNSFVKDLMIAGNSNSSSIPRPESVGTRHGILFEGTADSESGAVTYYRSNIENCMIRNFTGGGITLRNTGLSMSSNLAISDCRIYWCGAGVNIAYFSEFSRITNVTAGECLYGCIDNGGNNNFANCDFSGNTVGLLIDNSSGQSRNSSHGSFVGCTFNHSGNNEGTAIRILGAIAGEIFTAAQIFFGKIEIEDSIGIRFIGANIGRQTPIIVNDSVVTAFSDCTFVSASESPLTQSGNTRLVFEGCYDRAGNVFNPMQ